MNNTSSFSRREFFKISTVTGTALILGCYLPNLVTAQNGTSDESGDFAPNLFLRIDTDGIVTVTVPRSEMGQGVQTAFPMLVAEDLDVDWTKVRAEQALANSRYGSQVTGGSVSMADFYSVLRVAGYTARTMLISAAAQEWGVDPSECHTENGVVFHAATNQQMTYGELVPTAATLPVPRGRATLKPPEEFRIIGTRQGQIDNPRIVAGHPIYTSDVVLPNMLYAVVSRCPVFGGEVATFDATAAESISGVRQVVQIGSGVAVVADSTWAALQGLSALNITWNEGEYADLNSETIHQMAVDAVEATAAERIDSVNGAASVVDALYEVPYLTHVPIEPMVCVADVRADGCDVWAPTQDRVSAQSVAVSASGVSSLNVNIHVPMLGGGFGRRLESDFVREAVQISRAVGAPIKLIWTRADDIQHGFYRPLSRHRLRAGLDADGFPMSMEHYVVSQSPHELTSADNPYQIAAKSQRRQSLTMPIPTGYWRGVSNGQNFFARECFIDEIAAVSGRDPYELRMALLPERHPLRAVLELAATNANWGAPLADGWARGIACGSVWGVSPVAQVAEVSVSESGAIRVERVVCAVDCGMAINPDMIEAQMEGGIVFALSSIFYEEITVGNGRVQQSNFHDYPITRINEMPRIEIYIVPSTEAPTGVGEMSLPVAMPAIANAIFAATGNPVRKLPIRR